MTVIYPTLGDLWPFSEAAVAPELAALSVNVFFAEPDGSSIKAAVWTRGVDPNTAPRASYALRVRRAEGQGDLARWQPQSGDWETVARFPATPGQTDCSIIELNGILLGGVTETEGLKQRVQTLLASDLRDMRVFRILSKVLAVLSTITLFFAVRAGVESRALEPFLLVFALAVLIALIAVSLRAQSRVMSELGQTRLREQFQFEYRPKAHEGLSLSQLSATLRDHDRNREEEAVVFAFLLLLCFVYFISPLVVVGVVVALIVTTFMSADLKGMRLLGIAADRVETRLEQAFLSFRAGDDAMSPPALRRAKKHVLRDRLRRYQDVQGRLRDSRAKARLNQDLSMAVALVIIFSAYAFPIASGFQKLSIATQDSLVETSLFSVAPVIVLLSISKTTVALAQVASRRIASATQ